MKLQLRRVNEKYRLEITNESGNVLVIDNNKANGGDDGGFRPMQTVIAALGACTSIDVISILKKQRLEPFELSLELDAERENGKDANLWKSVHITYYFKGNVPREKAERAVQLSLEKYCSVSKTLEAGGTTITSTIIVSA